MIYIIIIVLPGIHQHCVIFNGHISLSRTSSLLSKCKFPASHSLTVLRRLHSSSATLTVDSDKMCFSCPGSSISCLAWGPRGLWGNIYCCPYTGLFGLKTLKRFLCISLSWTTGDLLFAHPAAYICEHLHGQCCRDKTIGYGIRETGFEKLTSLGFLCHKMEIIRISQAQYGDEANQKSSAMPHTMVGAVQGVHDQQD